MPDLDFSDVIESPEFSDTFSVIRTTDTVGNDGRSQLTPTQTDGLVGVLYFEAPETDVGDASARPMRQLIVITQFRLRDSSTGGQPDVVLFDGSQYTITSAVPWHRYGAGWVRGTAVLKKAVIPPVN